MMEFKIVTSKINFLDTTSKGVNIPFSSSTLGVNIKDNCSMHKQNCSQIKLYLKREEIIGIATISSIFESKLNQNYVLHAVVST